MNMRERMLAIVQGRMPDRVPFVQYSGLAAPDDEVWRLVGRENMGLLRWMPVYRLDAPNCTFETWDIERDGKKGFRRTLSTPEGRLEEERLYEPTYGTSAAASHFVKYPEDYRVLMAYFRDIEVRFNQESILDILELLGGDGLPHASVPRTPFQQLWVQWVGMGDLAAHMVECPDLMEEVFALMGDVQRRTFEVACRAVKELPIPYINCPDNITAPMVGKRYFDEYCVPAYNELAAMLDETGKDIPVYVHMDGNLKPLWDSIGASRVRGLDSMSPPPDNDTSVAEAVGRWPEMRVGINFPSSVHLQGPKAAYDATMGILEEGARTGRLQIQISENVPAEVWRSSFPEIVRAIADFAEVA